MTDSTLLAIVLLVIAVTDTLAAIYVLPNMLKRNDTLDEKDKKRLIALVNGGTLLFFGAAVVIYLLQPLG